MKNIGNSSSLYGTGILLALGMNAGLNGLSLKLLWSLLSWMDVGYLLVKNSFH